MFESQFVLRMPTLVSPCWFQKESTFWEEDICIDENAAHIRQNRLAYW